MDADLAGPQRQQPNQGFEQGGLAGSVWPDHGQAGAVRHLEGQIA